MYTWGAKNQAVPNLSTVATPPLISVSIGSIPKIFGVGLVQHWKEIFLGSEISADPQKPPWGQKFLPRRALFGVKNFVDFHIKKPSEPKTG